MNRRILLVAHPRRPEALTVAKGVIDRLTHLGIEVSLQADEAKVLPQAQQPGPHRDGGDGRGGDRRGGM